MKPMDEHLKPAIRRLSKGDKNFWLKYWREKNYNYLRSDEE